VSGGAGIDWNLRAADDFIAGPLQEFRGEYGGFPEVAVGSAYGFRNPYFSLVDAAVCHAFVRQRRPGLVVEVGSGFSSRVIAGALRTNGRGRLISIDPEPRADVVGIADETRRERVETLDPAFFRDLPPDSLLFIDSSHRAGTGSDVNFLFLEVLPGLLPGVLVHVHDIYLPDDYAPAWNIDTGALYTEQYLLHALLVHSSGFRVLWPGRFLLTERRAELAGLFPEPGLLDLHCSFWLQRV
jgi:hypothetical protein